MIYHVVTGSFRRAGAKNFGIAPQHQESGAD